QFAVVVRGSNFELLIERSGLFADAKHLASRCRYGFGLVDGARDPPTLDHRLAYAFQGLFVHGVVRGFGCYGHRTSKVDAGPEHRRENSTDSFDDGGLGEVTNDGDLQHQRVEDVPTFIGTAHCHEATHNDDHEREFEV